MNKEVSLPIAKLLNEKGIIFKTKLYYSSETKVTSVSYNEFAAPTVAEVVMWIYEKYGIWISVDTDINGRFRYSLRKYNITNGAWEVKNPTSISEYFNSPTEAYEAAILYTLNNLI